MKKETVMVSFDDEKLSALKMYMEQKNMQIETELEKSIETLYNKIVPSGVREFIDMKLGNVKSKKKNSSPSIVGAAKKEVGINESN